jgi:hypothetical protein
MHFRGKMPALRKMAGRSAARAGAAIAARGLQCSAGRPARVLTRGIMAPLLTYH